MEKKQDNFRAFRMLILSRSDFGKTWTCGEIIQEYVPKHISPKNLYLFSQTYKSDDNVKKQILYLDSLWPQWSKKNAYE